MNKFYHKFNFLITAITLPILILNIFGAFFALIWLAILGEWGLIFDGFLISFIFGIIFPFICMPSSLISILGLKLIERGKIIFGSFIASLSFFYVPTLLIIWCIYVLKYFSYYSNPNSIIPILIWSYSISLGPMQYWSKKENQEQEGDAWGTTMTLLFLSISYIIAMFMFFYGLSMKSIFFVFALLMLIDIIIKIVTFLSYTLKEKYLPNEIKKALTLLNKINNEVGSNFDHIYLNIKENLLFNRDISSKNIEQQIKQTSVEEFIYSNICFEVYRGLTSGSYSFYGKLTSQGEDLLNIFDNTVDILHKLNNISLEEAEEAKLAIREESIGLG